MIKDNCYNCKWFKETNEAGIFYSDSIYECMLHKSARISHPTEQYCNDVDTTHIIINKREEIFNKLGI